MEMGIPNQLIQQVQTLLRTEASIPSYDPSDSTIPSLQTLRDSIGQFDPSPSYLRCKTCNGNLLRGLQSMSCVYCGQKPNNEVPTDPIFFNSSFGYRWLLDSLGLDGSETVEPCTDSNDLYKGKKKESLFDLLDFQIKWSSESDENLVRNDSLTFTDVDFDNFFLGPRRDVFNASEGHLAPNVEIKNRENSAFQAHTQPRLFEMSSDSTMRPNRDEGVDNRDDGWQANFQFASTTTADQGSKSFDSFMGSGSDISNHIDTVFGHGTDKKVEDPKGDPAPSASMTNNWFQGDLWNNFNSGISQVEQFKKTIEIKDDGPVNNLNQGQTGSTKEADNIQTNEDFQTLDDWNDFTSSPAAQNPYVLHNQNSSMKVNNLEADIFTTNSVSSVEGHENVQDSLDVLGTIAESKSDDAAEALISQMHDLSFMLNNSLSVPRREKQDEGPVKMPLPKYN